jgi:hypothetical protein
MFRALVFAALAAVSAFGAVTRIEVTERADVLNGKMFGATGTYELMVGKVYFAVDPTLAANRIITDIDKAPRNGNGLVEFSSDLYVLKPRDPSKGNGAVLYEVSNRGRKGMLGMFNRGTGSLDPRTPEDLGDGFLMEQGYTLVWLGWQFDPPQDPGLMRLYTAVAKGITGTVRSEFIPETKTTVMPLADRNHIPYPVADPDDPKLTLTVRDKPEVKGSGIPRERWKFEDRSRIIMAAGFEPGKIYEIVYKSQDAPLVGLGPTAVRDLISHFKNGSGESVMVLGDQRRFIKRAYAFGVSQSGRFLRTFLYYGFNADEKERKVFDGMMIHVAGAGRGSFNHRFAQPSRDGHPFLNTFYPTDIFPYTDLEETDPETGLSGGILARAIKGNVVPKVFYTNSSYEYWGRAASLIHTTIDGKGDAPLPATTRIYLMAGGQHGPAGFPPSRNHTQNLANPNDFKWAMRALLMAMDRWVKDGVEPPASLYPRINSDTLVPLGALQFPKIPGVAVPTHMQKGYRVDYGLEFQTAGIVSIDPPVIGKAFPMFVPQVDRDGNETSGIRMPAIQAPLGTYTGWNLRSEDIGSPDELNSMIGSFIPFAKTKEDREKSGDPRPSIAERYASREEYLKRYEAAARDLAKSGYLLEGDIPRILDQGAKEWLPFSPDSPKRP